MYEEHPQPPSLEKLKALRTPVRQVNVEHRESLNALERVAKVITDRVGTMGFFFVIAVWTVLWLGFNTLAPKSMRFDPFPAFVFWLFISNMIQLLLLPLLMVGQNLQGRHAEKRAEADYEVNIRSEREIEAVFQHLEHQNKKLDEILRRLEK